MRRAQSSRAANNSMTSINDREFWEEFIELYRRHQCLWNSKSKEYSLKYVRDAAYSELVEKTRERYPMADRDFVTKKIHTLRCSFRREYKKVLDSKKFAAGEEDVYVPTLWYYDQLSFIADHGYAKGGKTTASGSDEEDNEDNDYANHFLEQQQNASTDPAETKQESPHSSVNPEEKWRFSIEKRKYARGAGRRHFSVAPIKKPCTAKYESEHLDEFDIAGRKYACDLRSMPAQQRLIVEKLVAEVVYYGKMEQLNTSSTIQFDGNYVENAFIPKLGDYGHDSGDQ